MTTSGESTLIQFSEAIQSQHELNNQLSRRTSQIIGWGILIIVLLFVAIGFFAWMQQKEVEKKTGVKIFNFPLFAANFIFFSII